MRNHYREHDDRLLLEEHEAHPERFREPIIQERPEIPCACGKLGAHWKGPFDGRRVYACDECHKALKTPND